MITKKILCAERVRRVPSQFSWVDHRLVRDRHIQRASAKAWALYLVLVTVSDADGLSYYSDAKLAGLLLLSLDDLRLVRAQLVAAGVLAYAAPFYQVLSLEGRAS